MRVYLTSRSFSLNFCLFMVYLAFMLVLFRVIVYCCFYDVFGVWVYLWFINVRLFTVILDLCFSPFRVFFLLRLKESPPRPCPCPWKGVHTVRFAIDFGHLFRADDASASIFAAFSNPTLITIQERHRSQPKKCFTLLKFF